MRLGKTSHVVRIVTLKLLFVFSTKDIFVLFHILLHPRV